MTNVENAKPAEQEVHTPGKLLALLIVGFASLLSGLTLVALAVVLSQESSRGLTVIIFIGPIPVVFGYAVGVQWLILLGVALSALFMLAFHVLRRKLCNLSI